LHRALVAGLGVRVVRQGNRLRLRGVRISGLDRARLERLLYFHRLLTLVESVEGDVVECGVAFGAGLSMLASLVRVSGKDRHIWGFDSWQGLPAPTAEDYAPPAGHAGGESSSEASPRDGLITIKGHRFADVEGFFSEASPRDVVASLKANGFTDREIASMVTLVRGPFSETLSRFRGHKIALLRVDADLYQSHKQALTHLWPHVCVGGVLALDEYLDAEACPGVKLAIDEYFAELAPGSVVFHRDGPTSMSYAVKLA
jgi:hypothetical protein